MADNKGGAPEQKPEENKAAGAEGAGAALDEEEDEGYTCSGCWDGYCGCVAACCKVNNFY